MKRKKIVFALVNGLGFGHFRRALTIADTFDHEQSEIIFITQAKSTRLFDEKGYKVINLPMMYLLGSNNAKLVFHTMLERLLAHIMPDVVIEDTHPLALYLSIPALATVPRILIIREVEEQALEDYLYNGYLLQYNKVFIMNDKESFLRQLKNPILLSLAEKSQMFSYCGNVFYMPSDYELQTTMNRYHMKEFEQTVVISFGAGGWQLGTNAIKDAVFELMSIANEYVDINPMVQFIFITGSYSSGYIDDLNSMCRHKVNITVNEYEEYLPALHYLADLCIAKPGYNSLMETLNGHGEIIFLPGVSYMENQIEKCALLKEKYGVDYVEIQKVEQFRATVINALQKPKKRRTALKNNARRISSEITQLLNEKPLVPFGFTVSFFMESSVSRKLADRVQRFQQDYPKVATICKDKGSACIKSHTMVIPIINMTDNYGNMVQGDCVVAIYHDEMMLNNRLEFYDKRHAISNNCICITLTEVQLGNAQNTIMRFYNVLSNPAKYSPHVVFKISDYTAEIETFLNMLEAFLHQYTEKMFDLDWAVDNALRRYIAKYTFEFEHPDISRVK